MVHVSDSGVVRYLRAMGDVDGPHAGRVVIRSLVSHERMVAASDSVVIEQNGVATYADGRRAYVTYGGLVIEDARPPAAQPRPAT